MKKTVIIIVLLIAIVLVSCIPEQVILEQETDIICNDPYIRFGQSCCLDKNNNNICDFDELEEPVEEEAPIEVFATEEDKETFIDKVYKEAVKRTSKGYSYTFDNKQFFIRSDKIKIRLPEYKKLSFNTELNTLNVMDTVYLNKQTMIATGYCEEQKYKTSYEISCRKLQDYPFSLVFSDYYEKTPMDWLEEYKDKEAFFVKELDRPVNQEPASSIVFDEEDVFTTLWVNYHTSVPLRIEVRKKNNGVVALYNWFDYEYYVSPDEVIH